MNVPHEVDYPQEDVDLPGNMVPEWINAFDAAGVTVHVDLIPYLRSGKNVTITIMPIGYVYYLDLSSYTTSGQKGNLTFYNERTSGQKGNLTFYNERGDVRYAIFSWSDVDLTLYNEQGNVFYNNPTFFRGWTADDSNDNIYAVGPSDKELTINTSNGIKEVIDFDTKTATVYDQYGNKYHVELSGKNWTVYNARGDIIAQPPNPFLISDKNEVTYALYNLMNPFLLSTYSYRHSFPYIRPQTKGYMMAHGPVVMTNKTFTA
jgi:hypothetical protein